MHYAAEAGHAEAAAALLELPGAPDAERLDAVAHDGRAPLHLAAAAGHAGVVAVLLQHGAAKPRNPRNLDALYTVSEGM